MDVEQTSINQTGRSTTKERLYNTTHEIKSHQLRSNKSYQMTQVKYPSTNNMTRCIIYDIT